MSDCIQMIPLFSGSSGNVIYVQFHQCRLLIDIGCSCKKVTDALHSVGVSPQELSGILITHDHSDHIQGMDVFTRKYGIPVYATEHTWAGIHAVEKKPHQPSLDHTIVPGIPIYIDGVRIDAFATSHDTPGSVGYRMSDPQYTISVVTDLGYISSDVRQGIRGSDLVLIEANYNHDMLWNGPYPWSLKKRVDGKKGHLSNTDSAQAILELILEGTKHFVLGHLSEENNSPRQAMSDVSSFLSEHSLCLGRDYQMQTANRYRPSEAVVLSESCDSTDSLSEWFKQLRSLEIVG